MPVERIENEKVDQLFKYVLKMAIYFIVKYGKEIRNMVKNTPF